MAFGLLVWVAWISLFLDGIAGIYLSDGPSFRPKPATTNLVDIVDDFGSNVISQDEGNLEDRVEKPVGFVYQSYKPQVPKPPKYTQVGQGSQTPQIQPDVDRLVNGELRRWESKLFEPITFPLSSGSQTAEPSKPMPPSKPQPTHPMYTIKKPDVPTHPMYKPSTQVAPTWKPSSGPQIPSGQGVTETTSSSSEYSSVPNMNIDSFFEGGSPFTSEDVRTAISVAYESPNAVQESNELPQSYTAVSQGVDNSIETSVPKKPSPKYPQVSPFPYEPLLPTAEKYNQKPPVFQTSYKPPSKPSQYPTASVASGPNFVVESYSQGSVDEVPSMPYVSPPRKPSIQSVSGLPSLPNWMEAPSFATIFGPGFPDFNKLDTMSENSVLFPQKVYSLPPQKPLRKTFVIRSKNRYQRGRFLQSKMTYTPEYKAPQVEISVKEPVKVQVPKAERKA